MMMNEKTHQIKLDLPNLMKASGFGLVQLVTGLRIPDQWWLAMSGMTGFNLTVWD